jgi:surfeit locus 1 family protein
MKQRVWPILLASGLGFALLLWLGVWQMQRLAWKNELIANFDKTKITVTGRFFDSPPLRLLSTYQGGAAWQVLQGFKTDDGKNILVSKGKVPQNTALPASTTATLTLSGHMQNHNKGRGFFDVDNNPAENLWYHWDVDAMLGQTSNNGEVLQLISGSPGTEGLFVDPPKSELRNNHLGYAITWFGLAAALLVMTGVFVRSRAKQS